MRLNRKSLSVREPWEQAGISLPGFDVQAMAEETAKDPAWVHFGAGNLFRAFPAALLQKLLDTGAYRRGVIVAEGFDYEIIDRVYRPYDNLSLLVVLKADGSVEKRVIGSVTESLKADPAFPEDWERLTEIFCSPSLQMISFTITEKGYAVSEQDLERGFSPEGIMGKVTALLYRRYQAGAWPLAVQSLDNCSRNGEQAQKAVLAYGEAWRKAGLVPEEFLTYLRNPSCVSFPWSMIDKITPRPDAGVQHMLEEAGFEDSQTVLTAKKTYTSAFVNAEEAEYLVVEDAYPHGRPPLEKAGVIFTDRNTVERAERMKVCTCLNPLHTAMALFGCLLGYSRISEEMQDADIRELITRMAYREAMPVAEDPGVLRPEEFLRTVLTRRLPNPFLPDTPQRIATDTSQKLAIRFGVTLRAYANTGRDLSTLTYIPLVLACYARYLMGVDDRGNRFEPSPDPLLDRLQGLLAPLQVRPGPQDRSCLKQLYEREDIFGVNLYRLGLGGKIEEMAAQLFAGPGAVRRTLHRYVARESR